MKYISWVSAALLLLAAYGVTTAALSALIAKLLGV